MHSGKDVNFWYYRALSLFLEHRPFQANLFLCSMNKQVWNRYSDSEGFSFSFSFNATFCFGRLTCASFHC